MTDYLFLAICGLCVFNCSSAAYNQIESVCTVRRNAHKLGENYTVLKLFTLTRIRFIQIDNEVFVFEWDSCHSLTSNVSIWCTTEIQNGFQDLIIYLPNLTKYKEFKVFSRKDKVLEEFTYNSPSRTINRLDSDYFIPDNTMFEEYCTNTSEVLLQWHIKENRRIPPLIECWCNGERICVNYEHQGINRLCNYTKNKFFSTVSIVAKKGFNSVDNFVCRITGKTSFSQVVYWKGENIENCQLEVEVASEGVTEPFKSTEMMEVDVTTEENNDQEEGTFPGRYCTWRLLRKGLILNFNQMRTLYYGPCDDMKNITNFTVPMPESATSLATDRFIYHDFDKIINGNYGVIFWIIDTSNFNITTFYCADDQGIFCDLTGDHENCSLVVLEDMTVFTHKVKHTSLKMETATCVLNDMYESRKSLTWDHKYLPEHA